MQLADVNGDGRADACGRAADRIRCKLAGGGELLGPMWGDAAGWGEARYFATIQFIDIDGDGKADGARRSTSARCATSPPRRARRPSRRVPIRRAPTRPATPIRPAPILPAEPGRPRAAAP